MYVILLVAVIEIIICFFVYITVIFEENCFSKREFFAPPDVVNYDDEKTISECMHAYVFHFSLLYKIENFKLRKNDVEICFTYLKKINYYGRWNCYCKRWKFVSHKKPLILKVIFGRHCIPYFNVMTTIIFIIFWQKTENIFIIFVIKTIFIFIKIEFYNVCIYRKKRKEIKSFESMTVVRTGGSGPI